MIAKITRGSRSGDLAAYLHGPGRANEHAYDGQAGGAVIGGNLGREGERDGKGWAADLREASAERPDIKNPVWHMSVRTAPGDRTLTDGEWREAMQEMGERMGWADKPHAIVRHGDDHVHVAVSRVGHGGDVWHGRNDRKEAQRARQAVEERLGLTRAPVRSTEATKRRADHQVTQGEHRTATATGATPPRVELAERVRIATDAAAGQGREGYERALSSAGVEYRANVAKTGRVSGYSFRLPGHRDGQGKPVWWKASQLDKDLSWNKTKTRLEQPREQVATEVPRGRFESKAKHEARTEQANAQASAEAGRAKVAAVPRQVQMRTGENSQWWDARRRRGQAQRRAATARVEAEKDGREAVRIARQAAPSPAPKPKTEPGQQAEQGGGMSALDRVRRAREQSQRGEREQGHER